jgi:phosphoribosyl-ATP pyrophosphohydrolase/phosphoribosyl-AMP cyclohydrolase
MSPAPETPAETLLSVVKLDAQGLVPVIAQEIETGMVRMFAWANREALELTASTGFAHFWSRSRGALWKKGESSGHTLAVRELRIDCDGDVVLYRVEPDGPSCHTGATSCFYRAAGGLRAPGQRAADDAGLGADASLTTDDGPPDPPAVIVSKVAAIIARRKRDRPAKSYVVSLLDAGFEKVNAKILEEARELAEALPEGDARHTAHEAADLLFHMLVGLEAAGVPVDAVFGELRRRFGTSGIDEKQSRAGGAGGSTSPRSSQGK